MKTILVTGGCGFVGHHCIEGILKLTDWNVVILDSLNYAGNLNRITDVDIWSKEKGRVKFVWHDLRSPISPAVSAMIGKVNYVEHMAAETHVDRSLKDAIPFVMSNVVGTVNLLDWCKGQDSIEKILIQGTDEIFGPAPFGVYSKESDPYRPSNPYSGSKVGEWAMGFAYANSFQMPIFHCISMNIFGERQDPEKFIPMVTKAMLAGEKIKIHGSPDNPSCRCWVHARNLFAGHLFLFENAQPKESYSIISGERDVLYMANRISDIVRGKGLHYDTEVKFIDFHDARPGHDFRYALSGEKMVEMGFRFPLDFEVSFDKMIRWMLAPKNKHWLNI